MKTVSDDDLFPIGIGTWLMGGDWDNAARCATTDVSNDDQEVRAIRYSLDIGQNHIDTAEMYGAGHTDEIVGKAIQSYSRDRIFIADKLWKSSFGEQETRMAIERMLRSLGTDYIDLLYIHSTFDGPEWERAVEPINTFIDEGVVRFFGVSNFSFADMERAAKLSSHPIAANQMLYNCGYKEEVTPEVKQYCSTNQIEIVAYTPVGRGELLANPVVQSVAHKHGVTTAQVALAWLIVRNALPIPKSSQKAHIDENFRALDTKLDDEDLDLLDAL
ncbi:MAG TPA: aldo/keto reductase [Acidimicrobiia bacterium]|nr:aldo/keto reductase [Acidimicrobiia bacterium]